MNQITEVYVGAKPCCGLKNMIRIETGNQRKRVAMYVDDLPIIQLNNK